MKLNDIVRYIGSLLSARDDVLDLSIPSDRDSYEFYYEGGPKMLEDRCIFDECTDDIKTALLEFYFSPQGLEVSFNWDVNVEFSKLAAKNGSLVELRAERFFPKNFADEWGTYFLHMAYFGSSDKYERELARLIEISLEDGRDGLFVGSWFSQSDLVQRTLMRAFCKWADDSSFGGGTGEMQALRSFIGKWKRTIPGFTKSECGVSLMKAAGAVLPY